MKSSILKALCVLILSIMPYVGYALGVMSYQGHLVDAANQPINGTIDITFSIPGTTWTETYTNVQVNNGLFGVILGSKTPLTTINWSQQQTLKIDYNGTSQTVPITGSPPILPDCKKDQIIKYNGTAWVCTTPNTGNGMTIVGGKQISSGGNWENYDVTDADLIFLTFHVHQHANSGQYWLERKDDGWYISGHAIGGTYNGFQKLGTSTSVFNLTLVSGWYHVAMRILNENSFSFWTYSGSTSQVNVTKFAKE